MLVAGYGHNGTMRRINEGAVLRAIVVGNPASIATAHDVRDGIATRVFKTKDVPHFVRNDVGLFLWRAPSESSLIHNDAALHSFRQAAPSARKGSGVPMLDVDSDWLDGGAKGRERSQNEAQDVAGHVNDRIAPCQARGLGVV